jgi:hypothetical protein
MEHKQATSKSKGFRDHLHIEKIEIKGDHVNVRNFGVQLCVQILILILPLNLIPIHM